jgi:hypothetical protein
MKLVESKSLSVSPQEGSISKSKILPGIKAEFGTRGRQRGRVNDSTSCAHLISAFDRDQSRWEHVF